MAKTAKTTGIYANMIACIGVDDDNTTAKDFVVSAGRTITLEAGVTVVSGAYGYGIRTVNNNAYSPKGFTLAPRIARSAATDEAKTAIYVLNTFSGFEDSGSADWEMFYDSTSGGSSFPANYRLFDDNPILKFDSASIYNSGSNALNGVRSMTVAQWEFGASPKARVYYAKNGEGFPGSAQYSDTTDRNADRAIAHLHRIGGYQGGIAFDVFLYMEFNAILSQSELATIYDSLTGSGACDCFEAGSTQAPRTMIGSRFLRSA